ncbi:hypothetical protein JOB18_015406 [Solea senegalensis]|uniref:Uncharacterized protein n=1 Tax=Solea senegalensis TaxID=28829 RepID=A0AAV6RN04_SOLSE|nr:hypothetical protein JOB18_015406 [Solea senegalensis]
MPCYRFTEVFNPSILRHVIKQAAGPFAVSVKGEGVCVFTALLKKKPTKRRDSSRQTGDSRAEDPIHFLKLKNNLRKQHGERREYGVGGRESRHKANSAAKLRGFTET